MNSTAQGWLHSTRESLAAFNPQTDSFQAAVNFVRHFAIIRPSLTGSGLLRGARLDESADFGNEAKGCDAILFPIVAK